MLNMGILSKRVLEFRTSKTILENVKGEAEFPIAADSACVIVLVSATSKITYDRQKTLADGVVFD